MKRPAKRAFVLAVGIVVIMFVAGCEEQEAPNTQSNIKRHKLIAAENRQLKKESEQLNKKIKSQKELLEKCLEEKENLQEKPQEAAEELMTLVFESFDEENKKLKEENKNLKARIEELEKQLEELKKQSVP